MRFKRELIPVVSVLILAGCQQPAPAPTSSPSMAQSAAQSAPAQSPVERGKYLTTVGGCNDCHTPKKFGPNGPEPDMSKELSGHPVGDKFERASPALIEKNKWGTVTNAHLTAWNGPWGVSFAMNLTPDKTTGLGSWTQEMFISAIRSGKHQGTGRAILPPMPWYWYRNMTDEDLKAVFAYLQSLPPVNNAIPDPLPPQ